MSLRDDFWFSWDFTFRPGKPVVRKLISDRTRWRIFKRDGFHCVFCGTRAGDTELEVDHLWPISRGGTNDEFNLAVCCKRCNRGKLAEYVDVFFTRYHRLGIFNRIYRSNPSDPVCRATWEICEELFGSVECWLDGTAQSRELENEYDRRLAEVEERYSRSIQ